ncbi:unnamed protein product [Allacma fusca]|uniref:Uncharacterized protein n=1 Tax=Allacma fusca TaxID=39272 RepID=A0A8J2NH04_9HEXA|nr:unnamed protein product [Allacma fusca]
MKHFLIFVCVSIHFSACLAELPKRPAENVLSSVLKSKPSGKLFFGKNHKDSSVLFLSEAMLEVDGSCHELLTEHPIESIESLGTCFRLFEMGHCSGKSLAVYPGSSNLDDVQLKALNFNVKSLGPCLENEFANAKVVNKDGKDLIFKDPALIQSYDSIPDLLQFDGNDQLHVEGSDVKEVVVYPGEFYYHGLQNQRLIFIWARANSIMNMEVFFEKLRSSLKEGVKSAEDDFEKIDNSSFEDSFASDLCHIMWNIDTAEDEEIDLFVNFLYVNESDAKPRASSYSIQSDNVIKNGLVKIP